MSVGLENEEPRESTIVGENFSFAPPKLQEGDVLDGCNLSQLLPNTPIGEGLTKLVFRRCNLLNCSVPRDAIVEDCLMIQKDYCSHLNPDLIEQGLPVCREDCRHAIASEKVSAEVADYQAKVTEDKLAEIAKIEAAAIAKAAETKALRYADAIVESV